MDMLKADIKKLYMDNIKIIGAYENNLKQIDVTIPKEKLVVLACVSGSGKSSLAFDTIAVESARQWQSSYPLYLVWLENLNLRGDYKARILAWVHEHHPELDALYGEIYTKGSREYWTALDREMREYTEQEKMPYMRDDDQHRPEFGDPPVVVNYFYHEEVRKSAKRKKE